MNANNNYGRGTTSHDNTRELLEFKLKQIDTALALEYDLDKTQFPVLLNMRLERLAELMLILRR